MVCNRCIKVVSDEINQLGHQIISIQLGKLVLQGDITPEELKSIGEVLEKNDFEIINNKQHELIESVKIIIIEYVQNFEEQQNKLKFSEFLSQKTGQNYFSLSRLFSSFEGITIEKYLILQKIEKVKELLTYNEATLSEIAFDMGYSSSAHLSAQFKKITGMAPSAFKNLRKSARKPIDKIR